MLSFFLLLIILIDKLNVFVYNQGIKPIGEVLI